MKDRISKILRDQGMTATKFAFEIKAQPSSISHILSGRNNPSADFLVKILERFNGINAEWLLTGKGNMYKSTLQDGDQKQAKPNIPVDLFAAAEKDNSIFNNEDDLLQQENTVAERLENSAFSSKPTDKIPINTQLLTNSKTVDKIVIFFTDKTFEAYTPNK